MLVSDSNVFLMKDYSDEEMIDIAESARDSRKTIIISRKVALNPSMIDKICKHFEATDVRVSIPIGNTSSSTIFDEAETEVLKLNFAKLEKNRFKALFIEGEDEEEYQGYTLEETLSASKKISHWVSEINGAMVGGRGLSPLEKFVYAYELVTKFIHNKGSESNDSPMDSRNLVKILNGDKIVCIGYASMLAELCKRVGIPCLVQLVIDGDGEKEGYSTINHASCKVYLNDPVYGYEGIVNADASKDAFKRGYGQTICHMALTDQEIEEIFGGKVKFAGESWFYSETINEFMSDILKIQGRDDGSEEYFFDIKNMSSSIEKIIIDVFSKNAHIFDKIASTKVKNLDVTAKELEETYYPSLYREIYRVATNPTDEYSAKELEKLLFRTLMVSNLTVDDLFAELLDFGNRFVPDENTLSELVYISEEVRAKENYDEIVEMSSRSESLDPLFVFEALTNVYLTRAQNEDFAVYKANSIVEKSVRFAMNKWNLNCDSNNYFKEEAVRLKKAYEAPAVKQVAL